MSLRNKPLVAPAKPRTRLQHVLRAGLQIKADTDAYADAEPPPEPAQFLGGDITISMDWKNWTGITNGKLLRLMLKPEGDATFQGYPETRFLSNIKPEGRGYVFYVEEGEFFSDNNVRNAWWVLARPKQDQWIYKRFSRPYKRLPPPAPGSLAGPPESYPTHLKKYRDSDYHWA